MKHVKQAMSVALALLMILSVIPSVAYGTEAIDPDITKVTGQKSTIVDPDGKTLNGWNVSVDNVKGPDFLLWIKEPAEAKAKTTLQVHYYANENGKYDEVVEYVVGDNQETPGYLVHALPDEEALKEYGVLAKKGHALKQYEITFWTRSAGGANAIKSERVVFYPGDLMPLSSLLQNHYEVESGRLEVKAIFAPANHVITYTDGVSDEEVFPDQKLQADYSCATPAFEGALNRENYVFAGWYPEVAETVTGDATYTAKWNAKYIHYIFSMNDGDIVLGAGDLLPGSELPFDAPVAEADEGFEFQGWTVSGGDGSIYTGPYTYEALRDLLGDAFKNAESPSIVFEAVVTPVASVPRTIHIGYVDEAGNVYGTEELEVAADATKFHSSELKSIPAGYELAEVGDFYIGTGNGRNVLVRPAKKIIYISYVDDAGNVYGREELEVAADAVQFNSGELKFIPAGYELVEVGDFRFGDGNGYNVKVRAAAKTLYISYVDEAGNVHGREQLEVSANATKFNSNELKEIPEGFEVCILGDTALNGNDCFNVLVRPAVKTLYISYVDEAGNVHGREQLEVSANATKFNSNELKEIPEGFEVCILGDTALNGNDCFNVLVRPAAKTLYISYVDEAGNVHGREQLEVSVNATKFNSNELKEIPEGFEVCVLGDTALNGNDCFNVLVRPAAAEKPITLAYALAENWEPVEDIRVTVPADANEVLPGVVTENMPQGFELVSCDYVIYDGIVYVDVAAV